MANQDFDINIRTTADTAGIRQTSAELDKLKQQQKDFLSGGPAQTGVEKFIAARQGAAGASTESDKGGGLTGSAVGLGTIVTLLTVAINKWQQFEDEQDRAVEKMVLVTAKMRELGESILEMQDKARDAARLGTEPLEDSFIRLQQEIIRLKTEQSLLNLPQQGDEWKKLNAEIATDEAYLKKVTDALNAQSKASEKAAQAKEKAAQQAGAKATALEAKAAALQGKPGGDEAAQEAAQARADAQRQEAEAREQQRAAARKESDFAEVRKYGRVLDPSERLSETIKEREELGQKAGQAQNRELQERLSDQMETQRRGITQEQLKNEREAERIPPTPTENTSQGIIKAIEKLNEKFDQCWR